MGYQGERTWSGAADAGSVRGVPRVLVTGPRLAAIEQIERPLPPELRPPAVLSRLAGVRFPEAHAHSSQPYQAVPVGGVGGECAGDAGEHGDGDAEAGRLAQGAQGEGVGDTGGPLVDGVEGGRGDDDGVRRGKGRGSAGVRQAERIGRPVWASTAAVSKKPFMATGVAMTPTSQSRSCAAVISLLTSAAIPAAQTTT